MLMDTVKPTANPLSQISKGRQHKPRTAPTGRKLARGSALRLALSVTTAAVSVLIMPFIVHRLGDRHYGIWTLVASFMGYYGILDLGLSAAAGRYLAGALGADDHDDFNRVFNSSLALFVVLGGLVFAVSGGIAAMAPLLTKNAADAVLFWKVILIMGASVALTFPSRVFESVLEAHYRFDLTAGFDLATLILRTGLIVLVLLLGHGLLALAWMTLLAAVPLAVIQAWVAFRKVPLLRLDRKYWHRHTTRRLFSYSVFSLIAALANLLRFRMDAIVVASFVGLAAVTHYRIGSIFAQYFMDIMSSMMGVFRSVFSRQFGARDHDALERTFFFSSKLSVCIATFVGFGMLVWGRPFIARWMGPRYHDSYPVLAILVVGIMIQMWQGPSINLLYGISRHKFFALFNSIEGVANLVLSIALVHKYGMYGVALGTMIPMVITKIFIQPVYVCRVAGIDYGAYVRKTFRTLAAASASLLIPLVISLRFERADYKVLFLLGTASAVLYAVPLWLFEFSPAESAILRNAILPHRARATGVSQPANSLGGSE